MPGFHGPIEFSNWSRFVSYVLQESLLAFFRCVFIVQDNAAISHNDLLPPRCKQLSNLHSVIEILNVQIDRDSQTDTTLMLIRLSVLS